MEVLAGAIVGATLGVIGRYAYIAIKDKQAKPEKREYVYLIRISAGGKIEIKNAPGMLWNWKY